MVDAVTLIMIIIMAIALLITNIYILVYFSHPEDKDSIIGWILKFIVILGLTLAWCQVLLIPLDVSNNRTFGGGINMRIFWLIIFVITLVYILVIFPISSSLYEAQDEWTVCQKIKHCICFFLITIIFFVALTAILYSTIGRTDIPIKVIKCQKSNTNIFSDSNIPYIDDSEICQTISEYSSIELKVNIIIYAIAILTFFSWAVFALFGGIGLASVPIDFFISFINRPKSINNTDAKERKRILFEEIEELQQLGEEIADMELNGAQQKFFFTPTKRKYNRKKNEFVSRFALVQKEFDVLNRNNYIETNIAVVFYYLLIPLGIFTSILTILWIIQFICSYFYILKGLKDRRAGYPFLSYLLIFFQDHDVSFLSFIFFSILTLYLLFCVIKGNFQFGIRFLCCWSVHPMKKGKTYMNSFLFNISLILLGSMAITQFVSDCLTDYIAFTDIDTLFNTLIKNLKFFKYFYRYYVFQYILFGIFVLSLIYLICKPWEKPDSLNKRYINRDKNKEKDKDKKDKKNKKDKKQKNIDKTTEDGGSQENKLMHKKQNSNIDEKDEKLDVDEKNVNIINSFEDDMT